MKLFIAVLGNVHGEVARGHFMKRVISELKPYDLEIGYAFEFLPDRKGGKLEGQDLALDHLFDDKEAMREFLSIKGLERTVGILERDMVTVDYLVHLFNESGVKYCALEKTVSKEGDSLARDLEMVFALENGLIKKLEKDAFIVVDVGALHTPFISIFANEFISSCENCKIMPLFLTSDYSVKFHSEFDQALSTHEGAKEFIDHHSMNKCPKFYIEDQREEIRQMNKSTQILRYDEGKFDEIVMSNVISEMLNFLSPNLSKNFAKEPAASIVTPRGSDKVEKIENAKQSDVANLPFR